MLFPLTFLACTVAAGVLSLRLLIALIDHWLGDCIMHPALFKSDLPALLFLPYILIGVGYIVASLPDRWRAAWNRFDDRTTHAPLTSNKEVQS